MREYESSGSVLELNKEHVAIQVVDFTENPRSLFESYQTFMIPDRSDESAMFFDLLGLHVANLHIGRSNTQHLMCLRLYAAETSLSIDKRPISKKRPYQAHQVVHFWHIA